MGDKYTNPPQSRNEAILRATIDGTEYTDPPQSRIEDLLIELKEAIEQGGGSVESYEQLTNKPQINGTTLSGNKTTEDLIPIGDGLNINADGELETADAYIPTSEKGTASGVATLTEAGKVPEGQLPSYVDDVIEGYLYEEHFYADAQHTEEITGEVGKIYVDLTTNRCYRWSGSVFVEIGDNRTFTANRALVSDASGLPSASNVTDTEIGYLSGVTGAIQTQIDGKQNTLTFDSTPTAQSTNPVTSGGIKTYVDGQGAKTVSGNPITLTDAEAMNADHVVATITPTQTGSGTPSPSNVRPFVGFSSVEVTVADAPTDPTTTKTYTVQLGDTYYQGEIDLTSGVLRCRQKFVEFNGSEQWYIENGYRATHVVSDIKSNTSNSTVPNILSSQFEATTPTATWWGGIGITVSLTNVLMVAYGDYTKNADTWKAYLEENPLQVVYELATPIEIQLTPTQIELLENNNTITTNVTSLDIKYQANTTIGDTLSVLDKRVTRLETKVPQPPTTDGTYKLTVTVASGEPTYSWESAT